MADDFPDLYRSASMASVQNAFWSLDDPASLDNLMFKIQSSSSCNFVLDFNDLNAWAAFDLALDSMTALLKAGRPSKTSTRWINIWFPAHHRPLLEALGAHYDFSPRLLGLMCSDPRRAFKPPTVAPHTKHSRRLWHRKDGCRSTSASDVEKGCELSGQSSISSCESALGGNLYSIVDDVWHYSSVDFGRNCESFVADGCDLA